MCDYKRWLFYEAASATFLHLIYIRYIYCDSKIKNVLFVSFMLPSITIHFIVNKACKTKYILGIDFPHIFKETPSSPSLTDRSHWSVRSHFVPTLAVCFNFVYCDYSLNNFFLSKLKVCFLSSAFRTMEIISGLGWWTAMYV